MHHAFHIHILQKITVFHFGYLYRLRIDTQPARTRGEHCRIDQAACHQCAYRQTKAVAHVPGFLFQFYIHFLFKLRMKNEEFQMSGRFSVSGQPCSKSYCVMLRRP